MILKKEKYKTVDINWSICFRFSDRDKDKKKRKKEEFDDEIPKKKKKKGQQRFVFIIKLFIKEFYEIHRTSKYI